MYLLLAIEYTCEVHFLCSLYPRVYLDEYISFVMFLFLFGMIGVLFLILLYCSFACECVMRRERDIRRFSSRRRV
jgi:hypothetical protein